MRIWTTGTALALATLLAGGALTVSTAPPAAAAVSCAAPGNTITGTSGDDVLIGTPGRDVIDGRGGHDYIDGGGGNDTLHGGAGNDVVIGGQGWDCVYGGLDDDTVVSYLLDYHVRDLGVLDGGGGMDEAYDEDRPGSASVERSKY